MEALDFFKLMQTTRSQPQYGYVISGIRKADLSDLAQHHYLVALIGWYLARQIIDRKGKISLEKVMELCLVHDLGELFGGDIGMPYAKVNKVANIIAKKFEQENQRYLARTFKGITNLDQLFAEALEPSSDEGVIAKVADYIEVTHYKHYLGRLTDGDIPMILKRLETMVAKVKDRRSKEFLTTFLQDWSTLLGDDTGHENFEFAKAL